MSHLPESKGKSDSPVTGPDTTRSSVTCCSTSIGAILPTSNDLTPEEYLAALSTYLLEYMNHHKLQDFTPILSRHCDPQYIVAVSGPEGYISAQGRERYLENVKSYFATNPAYHLQVQNTAIQVDEKLNRAIVFLTTQVRGILGAEHVVRESVNCSYWKRRTDGQWVAIKLETMRGPGHLTF